MCVVLFSATCCVITSWAMNIVTQTQSTIFMCLVLSMRIIVRESRNGMLGMLTMSRCVSTVMFIAYYVAKSTGCYVNRLSLDIVCIATGVISSLRT